MDEIVKVDIYWECRRCGNSLGEDHWMIPCARGSCEAEVKGRLVTTLIRNKTVDHVKEESKETDS